MQLRSEQLAAHLERPLQPLYVVHGDEPLLVIEAADAIRAAGRRQGYDEREVLVAGPGFDWSQLFAAGSNLSLFGGRKLIDLRIPTGKPGRDGGQALQDYCGRLTTDTLTLVTLPELGWQDEKAAWFAALSAGVVIKVVAPTLDALPGWIAGRLRRQDQSADPEALAFIAERVEGNLLAAHQEIQKLELLYPARKLSLSEVEAAVLNVARYDLDSLREALLAGDIGRLARTLEGLMQEGEAPPLVLWAMTEEIRALAQARSGMQAGRPIDQLLRDAKVWGTRQAPFRRALQRLEGPRLTAALETAARIDRLIKGIGSGDVWGEFLRLGLALAV